MSYLFILNIKIRYFSMFHNFSNFFPFFPIFFQFFPFFPIFPNFSHFFPFFPNFPKFSQIFQTLFPLLPTSEPRKKESATPCFCDGFRYEKQVPFQQSEELTVTAASNSARLIDTNDNIILIYLEKPWLHTSAIKKSQRSSPTTR